MTPTEMPQTFTATLADHVHTLTRRRRNQGRRARKRIVELERKVEILTQQVSLYQSLAISAAIENWNLKHGTET